MPLIDPYDDPTLAARATVAGSTVRVISRESDYFRHRGFPESEFGLKLSRSAGRDPLTAPSAAR